jgi:hypothetical protein
MQVYPSSEICITGNLRVIFLVIAISIDTPSSKPTFIRPSSLLTLLRSLYLRTFQGPDSAFDGYM